VGHGLSEGERVYITDFDNYCKDVVQHVNVVKNEHKRLPFFIVAHSMVSTSRRRCRGGGIKMGVVWDIEYIEGGIVDMVNPKIVSF